MTAMSKLRAARIVRMCLNYTQYDPSVVHSPVYDELGRKHWRVSYTSEDEYSVIEDHGVWQISRIDALVCCDGWMPGREDVKLL